jgi:uncharacterized membrane protein YqiK
MAQAQRQLLVRETSLANIQENMVKAEQGVHIAELEAHADIKHAEGQAKATQLQAAGEAHAIRSRGEAQAKAYQVGVESLGAQTYGLIQLMQIIGQNGVRVVPDVAVSGRKGNGLVDSLIATMLMNQQNGHSPEISQPLSTKQPA